MINVFKKYKIQKSIARNFNTSLLIFEVISYIRTSHRATYPFLFIILLFSACEESEKAVKKEEYKGPVSEVYGINMTYSDSAKLVVRMSTEAQLTMANEDKKYPKEVRVFFFDKFGNNTTKLRGDSAVYIKQTNLYRIMGRVQINNQVKNEVLETDELFWNPNSKKIYSDKPVDIKTPEQTIHGVGMDSNQDFTEYTIRRISNSQVSVKNLPQ
jgi:LPS export ABC transporter protein LptC